MALGLVSLLGLAAVLALTGCGPVDACNQLGNAILGLRGRVTGCMSTGTFLVQGCEAGLASCTASDKQTLINFANCFNAIPAVDCTTDPNAAATVNQNVQNCGSSAGGLSAACVTATGLDQTLGPPASTGFEESGQSCPSVPAMLKGTGQPGTVCSDYTSCAPTCCSCSNGDGHQYLGAACQSGSCAATSSVCPLVEQDQTGLNIPCP